MDLSKLNLGKGLLDCKFYVFSITAALIDVGLYHPIQIFSILCLYWVDRYGNEETTAEIHFQKDQIEVYLYKFELGE